VGSAQARPVPPIVQGRVLSAATTLGLRAAYDSDHAGVDVRVSRCPRVKVGAYRCGATIRYRIGTIHNLCHASILARRSQWHVISEDCLTEWVPRR
jgi:hypothetical protein